MPNKKLTDNEIIKVLECLEKDTNCGDCAVIKQCKGDCVFTKCLDLINRLQVENERLKNAYRQCAYERDAYIEIENTAIAEAKFEAYKEFAEKLHEELRIYGTKDKFNKSVFLNVVDKAKKELVGEESERQS